MAWALSSQCRAWHTVFSFACNMHFTCCNQYGKTVEKQTSSTGWSSHIGACPDCFSGLSITFVVLPLHELVVILSSRVEGASGLTMAAESVRSSVFARARGPIPRSIQCLQCWPMVSRMLVCMQRFLLMVVAQGLSRSPLLFSGPFSTSNQLLIPICTFRSDFLSPAAHSICTYSSVAHA